MKGKPRVDFVQILAKIYGSREWEFLSLVPALRMHLNFSSYHTRCNQESRLYWYETGKYPTQHLEVQNAVKYGRLLLSKPICYNPQITLSHNFDTLAEILKVTLFAITWSHIIWDHAQSASSSSKIAGINSELQMQCQSILLRSWVYRDSARRAISKKVLLSNDKVNMGCRGAIGESKSQAHGTRRSKKGYLIYWLIMTKAIPSINLLK